MKHGLVETVECDKCHKEIELIIPVMVDPETYVEETLERIGWLMVLIKDELKDYCPDCRKKYLPGLGRKL